MSLSLTAMDRAISLNWTAPFSLDITDVKPDIEYCVDVSDSTSSLTLSSLCGITVTEFSYPLPPDRGCHDYVFTVTPVNVVGNGTQANTSLPAPGGERTCIL